MSEKKMPKIRFPEFTGDWEQRKLGEISDSYSGGTPTAGKAEYYGGSIPFIRSAEVNSDTTELFLTDEGLKNSSAKMVKKGDILYALYGATSGEVGLARLDGAINQAILDIKPHKDYDAPFLMQWLRKSKENITGTYLQGGQGNLSGTIVTSLMIDCPNYDEQKKIGVFFANLDNLITLHQRKCEKIKEYKKGCLQKMFPKEEESIPEVRFSGFTGDWEQRKFAEVFDWLQNNTLSRAELNYEGGIVKNVHYGDVLIKFGDYIDASETELPYISDDTKVERFKNSFLHDGDIIIADTAEDDTVGKCTEIQGSEGIKLLSGLHTIACRPKEKYGAKYMGYYINSPAYHNQLKPLMQGIKVTSISKSALQDTDLLIPKSIDEQGKIGDFFSDIDCLIALHQRECDKYKELKKGLLQQMFV